MTRRWTQDEATAAQRRMAGQSRVVEIAAPTPSPEATALFAAQRKSEREKLQAALWRDLEFLRLAPYFEREVRFHPERKWRFDFFARPFALAIEVQGGTFTNGHHVRGKGYEDNRRKANAAAEMGIVVLEYTGQMIASGEAAAQIERLVKARQSR